MSSFKMFRVRFCEWQSFAINISARTQEEAIDLARTIRDNQGTEPFEELDGNSEGWEAEEVQP
jgi:hypothetical protein